MSVGPTVDPRPKSRTLDVRQASESAIAGALGAVCGLYLYVELVHADSIWVRDALAGCSIGGSIGFFIHAFAPAKDGAWLKLARASTFGALAGAIGGSVGLVVGEVVLDALKGG
jgi:hypothetical protein